MQFLKSVVMVLKSKKMHNTNMFKKASGTIVCLRVMVLKSKQNVNVHNCILQYNARCTNVCSRLDAMQVEGNICTLYNMCTICNAIKCNAMQYVQYAMQVQGNICTCVHVYNMQCNAMQCNAMQYVQYAMQVEDNCIMQENCTLRRVYNYTLSVHN